MGAATSAEAARPKTASRSWQLEPGAELGPWRVVEPLGAGGMGEVYVAEHAWLPTRRAALKVLLLERVGKGRVADRFRAEAALLASIDHPNVVRLYDAQITDDGRAWMAMELLAGKPLSELLASHGRVNIPNTLQILGDVADGTHAAHVVGIVHRDLKPGNIFITSAHVAKVLDFGISKLAEHRFTLRDLAPSTEKNIVLGTIPYMSPEQLLGQALDHRSDIYALGVIAFQMLTGHHPFVAPGEPFGLEQLGYRALFTEPTSLQTYLPDCPMDLWLLVRSAFARKREDRPSSMAKLAEKMRALRGAFLAERGLPIASLDGLLGARTTAPVSHEQAALGGLVGPVEVELLDDRARAAHEEEAGHAAAAAEADRDRAMAGTRAAREANAFRAAEPHGGAPPDSARQAIRRRAAELVKAVMSQQGGSPEGGESGAQARHVTPFAAAATTEAVELPRVGVLASAAAAVVTVEHAQREASRPRRIAAGPSGAAEAVEHAQGEASRPQRIAAGRSGAAEGVEHAEREASRPRRIAAARSGAADAAASALLAGPTMPSRVDAAAGASGSREPREPDTSPLPPEVHVTVAPDATAPHRARGGGNGAGAGGTRPSRGPTDPKKGAVGTHPAGLRGDRADPRPPDRAARLVWSRGMTAAAAAGAFAGALLLVMLWRWPSASTGPLAPPPESNESAGAPAPSPTARLDGEQHAGRREESDESSRSDGRAAEATVPTAGASSSPAANPAARASAGGPRATSPPQAASAGQRTSPASGMPPSEPSRPAAPSTGPKSPSTAPPTYPPASSTAAGSADLFFP